VLLGFLDSIIKFIGGRRGKGIETSQRRSADDDYRDRLILAGVEARIVASASAGELDYIGRVYRVSRPPFANHLK
jgi:hypothetical protein